ncbi:acyl-CoA dehydrogenase family protein [Aeromicrobium endophyticum]|uniref:Acyl-CoA dehydrogenase n=1 Tax=Aeromicrobium endophyticum TaxID=2292704 RepID=A0A371P5Z5_9ACTN|nr:acyl-CoA dehydrogenase family protein [Aeromicrobium endophyticum]REK70968.1 hypothetical protein DX116_18005 [Aeromicrobium endophyticum]
MTTAASLDRVLTDVRAIAERARAEAVQREREGTGLGDLVADLLSAGLGRLRVPARLGGVEASVAQLGSVLVDLSAAESNLTQVFRGHLGFVELLLQQGRGAVVDELLGLAGQGRMFGPAASSRAAGATPGGAPPGPEPERPSGITLTDGVWLHDDGDGLRLSGAKYYTTGSLYADWINVLVVQESGVVEVVVPRDDPGVVIVDDWNGFGQRFTASGTATFTNVPVRDGFVLAHDDPDVIDYLGAFYQLVHSATQAGIAQRATEDAAEVVRRRRRTYPLAGGEPQQDPHVLGVVGEMASRAFGARASVALLCDRADGYLSSDGHDRRRALDGLVADSAAVQVLNSRLSGEVGWLLFDAASASALDADLALDRHWRNARAVSSHNPSVYKARLVGDVAVNGTLPAATTGPRA